MTRSDSTWLTLRAGLGDVFLQEHCRPYQALDDLVSPEQQTPQMIMLIGQNTKTLAMRKIGLGSFTQESISGEVHLRLEMNSIKDESPVLFADCELHSSSVISKAGPCKSPGDIIRRSLKWHREASSPLDPTTLAHLLYSKLLAPFSTVLCIFAEDLGGLKGVAQLLSIWLLSFNKPSSDLPQGTRPGLLILTKWGCPAKFDEQAVTKSFLLDISKETGSKQGILLGRATSTLKQAELDRLLATHFSSIQVLAHPVLDEVSRLWKPLRSRILSTSALLQAKRKEAHIAFSSYHFKAFFHHASDHVCSDISSPFSFIQASRIRNPIPTELSKHLASFLEVVNQDQIFSFVVPVIASSLVFEGYPQGMHGFHPSLVFKQFFWALLALVNPFQGVDQGLATEFTKSVENLFCEYAMMIISGEQNFSHLAVLKRYKENWKSLYSNTTCFPCLTQRVEDTLTCGHSMCSSCTMEHGYAPASEPWTFQFDLCPLCEEPNGNKFPQKPHTAGVRAIIAEGGGIRGIVPLVWLIELENAVALQPMGIQEHFDMGVGCSSGSMTILGLFDKRWSPEECLTRFQRFSRIAFRRRQWFGFPWFSLPRRIFEIVSSFTTDSKYSSAGITEALISAFGSHRTLFERPCGGAKVAVVATTIEDSSTCLFSNYNGPEKRPAQCGYKIVRPDSIKKEFFVWQAARASSAAPPYFKPFNGYQDGGLGGHNNPINLALWEQDAIWGRDQKQPDAVVSLGTGFTRVEVDADNAPTSFLRSRCIPRLFRSFLNFFVGETRWQELQNSLPLEARNRYHRMNIEFFGEEPELDDLQAMPRLQHLAKAKALSTDIIQNCADNLLASLFYIELKAYPIFEKNLFTCKGQILCRINPTHPALLVLARRLSKANAYFYLKFDENVACVDDDSMMELEAGSIFYRDFIFRVLSLDEVLDIKIDGITKRARSISNCPYKLKSLIKDQGLDCAFGNRRKKRPRQQQANDYKFCKRAKYRH